MKRAPFLCKQSPDRTLEVVILAGSLAWETSHVWRKDPDREDDVPPMVLGPDELADLSNLTIIRPTRSTSGYFAPAISVKKSC